MISTELFTNYYMFIFAIILILTEATFFYYIKHYPKPKTQSWPTYVLYTKVLSIAIAIMIIIILWVLKIIGECIIAFFADKLLIVSIILGSIAVIALYFYFNYVVTIRFGREENDDEYLKRKGSIAIQHKFKVGDKVECINNNPKDFKDNDDNGSLEEIYKKNKYNVLGLDRTFDKHPAIVIRKQGERNASYDHWYDERRFKVVK